MAFSLTDVSRTIRSELMLIFLGFISLSLIAFTIYSFINSSSEKDRQQTTGVTWNGISPGESTKNQVLTNLGNPLESTSSGNTQTLLYSSASEYRPHKIELLQDTATLIKEQIVSGEKGGLDSYLRDYGRPEKIIYGQHGTFAPGHFWGQYGLLVFANSNDGVVIEVWYFPTQSLDSFLAKYPGFSTEPTHRRESY